MDSTLINAKEIGARIRALRLKKNKTQSYFADIVYITPSYLSLIEDGQRIPNVEVLAQIAKVADVSIDYLIYGTEENSTTLFNTFSRLCSTYSEDEMKRALRLTEYYLKLSKLKNPDDEINL